MAIDDIARRWLRENGYADVAAIIDDVMDEWKASGKQTRRNWWEMLAGDRQGRPRRLGKYEFPILKSVQIRQGLPVTPNAIQRGEEKEAPPNPRVTARWPKVKKNARASGVQDGMTMPCYSRQVQRESSGGQSALEQIFGQGDHGQ